MTSPPSTTGFLIQLRMILYSENLSEDDLFVVRGGVSIKYEFCLSVLFK